MRHLAIATTLSALALTATAPADAAAPAPAPQPCLRVTPKVRATVDAFNTIDADVRFHVTGTRSRRVVMVSDIYRNGVLEYHDKIAAVIPPGTDDTIFGSNVDAPLSWKAQKLTFKITMTACGVTIPVRTGTATTPAHPVA